MWTRSPGLGLDRKEGPLRHEEPFRSSRSSCRTQSDDLTMPKYVGIDISKDHLDWALRSDEEALIQTGQVANTPE